MFIFQDVLTAFDFLPDEMSPDTSQVIDLDLVSGRDPGMPPSSHQRASPPPPIPPKPDRMRQSQYGVVPEPQQV